MVRRRVLRTDRPSTLDRTSFSGGGHKKAKNGAREDLIAELTQRAQAGDAYAEGALMEHHKGLVECVCYRLRLPCHEWEEYLSAGQMGMRDPIRRYDPARGIPLWGYAYKWVRGAIVDERGLRFGLSPHQASCYRRVRKAWQDLLGEGEGAAPDVPAVAEAARKRYGVEASNAMVASILSVEAQVRTRAIGEADHLERLAFAAEDDAEGLSYAPLP